MGHYASPTGPFVRPVPVPTFWTAESGWAGCAIAVLLDERDAVVDGIFIAGQSLNPKVSVWLQLRKRLRAHGIVVPDELTPSGCAG
jgi:hypothetical protein